MKFPENIYCLQSIKVMKLYIREVFCESEGSYFRTKLQPFQGLYQANVGSPQGPLMTICILIPYLKEKVYRF